MFQKEFVVFEGVRGDDVRCRLSVPRDQASVLRGTSALSSLLSLHAGSIGDVELKILGAGSTSPMEKGIGAAWTRIAASKAPVKGKAFGFPRAIRLLCVLTIYLVTRGEGNNSATTTPITNIQIKLLLSSILSTARLFNGENKRVAKISVQHTVPIRPAKVPNLIVTATTTTKNRIGSMDFRELCRNEKVRPKARTTQSPVPSSALAISLRHILIKQPFQRETPS